MVRQLQIRTRHRRNVLIGALLASVAIAPAGVRADDASAYLGTARSLFQQGQYFRAGRYAFAAIETSQDANARGDAYSWVSGSLVRAHLYDAATYFFIRTLQSGNRAAIRRVLADTETLFVNVGPDVLRKYLTIYTTPDDYEGRNRSAYLYAMGKDALLAGQEEKAINYLGGIASDSALYPFALQLRGSAYAIRGSAERAIQDFRECVSKSDNVTRGLSQESPRYKQAQSEGEDLAARCQADEARTLYQADRFDDADRAYDKIPKASIVWPDILFEQAWNSFARREYNRTLGKLVSYKSPALSFVFNPETDVLRSQSYLALCLYTDANDAINDFNGKYAKIGEQVKQFVESNSRNLEAFYDVGKSALRRSIYSQRDFDPMLNRFIRGPYFSNLVRSENDIDYERDAIKNFAQMQSGVNRDPGAGFPGFLNQVLAWRTKAVKQLGGIFVKNSLLDYHSELISDFEKMAFIKLEMLKRAKDQLLYKNASKHASNDRSWGNLKPSRRDYQYYWTFNGEFWNDELGDYVFGLESECRGSGEQ